MLLYADMIHGSKSLEDQFYIRKKVFIDEQGVSENIERDGLDECCMHCVVYEEKKPVATGRIVYEDDQPLIGRIAVLKEHRGKKYGDLVVRKLIDYCFRQGEERVEVHAQMQVVEFYEKIGFKRMNEPFYEADILHQAMYITREMMVFNCET